MAQSGSDVNLVAGQVLAIGIRAQREASEVELFVNGVSLAKLQERPWVFSFNVPVGVPSLELTVVARAGNGTQLAYYGWQQPVLPDAGTLLTGRVVDGAGNPLPGARVTV